MEQIKLFFTLSFFSIITAGYYNNYSNPPIIVATVCGDLSQVKSYCTASTINAKGNNGQTALMHSCISNSGDIFVFLMENNADFKIKDNFGKTALDYAIEHNRVEMIEYLAISSGLDVDQALKAAKDAQEITNKKIKIKEFLMETNKPNPDLDKIRSCIAGGVDVNAKDNHGWTALLYAVYYGNTEIEKLLISAGADVNARDNNGSTALIWAATNRSTEIEIIKLLIAAGADVNVKPYAGRHGATDDGFTALMWSAKNGRVEIANILLAAGADINDRDDYGCTSLMIAVNHCHTETAKLLIASGADVNIKKNNGDTALIWAAKNGGTEIANILLAAGADVNIKNNVGTALMIAAGNGYTEIVKLLIDSGAKKSLLLMFKINHPDLYDAAVIGSGITLSLGLIYLIEKLKR